MTHAALRITLQSRCCGTTTVAGTGASAHAAAKRVGVHVDRISYEQEAFTDNPTSEHGHRQ